MPLVQIKSFSHFLLISQATGHASWRGKWWRAATWWLRRFDLVDLHDLHLWKATWWPRRFGQIFLLIRRWFANFASYEVYICISIVHWWKCWPTIESQVPDEVPPPALTNERWDLSHAVYDAEEEEVTLYRKWIVTGLSYLTYDMTLLWLSFIWNT